MLRRFNYNGETDTLKVAYGDYISIKKALLECFRASNLQVFNDLSMVVCALEVNEEKGRIFLVFTTELMQEIFNSFESVRTIMNFNESDYLYYFDIYDHVRIMAGYAEERKIREFHRKKQMDIIKVSTSPSVPAKSPQNVVKPDEEPVLLYVILAAFVAAAVISAFIHFNN